LDQVATTSSDETRLNGILHLSDYLSENPDIVSSICDAVPPHLALAIHENSLTAMQLQCFNYCYDKCYDLDRDDQFMTWKALSKTAPVSDVDSAATISELDASFNNIQDISLTSSAFDLDLLVAEPVRQCTGETGPTEVEAFDQPAATSTGSANYSFGNRSYPGDQDSDVLPYPAPIERKRKSAKKT
jgi:hypothetical protein